MFLYSTAQFLLAVRCTHAFNVEKALSILVVYLFPYGCGIFRFFEIEPEKINEILEDVIETHQEAFGSEFDDFERWKDLYLSRAEKNEEILVAVA
ncbi:MAG: hypothetical protein V7L00_06560 [Nostoc sp.]|uniref:hypothetical protein n=1 Tax=Nostoc sp. TaxID=1180 RepID=UPI002FF8B205